MLGLAPLSLLIGCPLSSQTDLPYRALVVHAITTVFGNVNVRQAAKNVSRILSDLRVDKRAMPAVYQGANAVVSCEMSVLNVARTVPSTMPVTND